MSKSKIRKARWITVQVYLIFLTILYALMAFVQGRDFRPNPFDWSSFVRLLIGVSTLISLPYLYSEVKKHIEEEAKGGPKQ